MLTALYWAWVQYFALYLNLCHNLCKAFLQGNALCNMAASTQTLRARPSFYLCGDSLTQDGGMSSMGGWGTLLQDAYARSVDVINRGLCGYNTNMFRNQAMPVIRAELRSVFKPTVITLWLGANDAALVDGMEPELHVPLAEYQANLVSILTELRQLAPQATLLLITPPTVDDDRRRRYFVEAGEATPGKDPIDRSNQQAARYAAACHEAASQVDGVTLLDMHAHFSETYPDVQERGRYFGDGLHFTREGNSAVFEQIHTMIQKLVPKEHVEPWQLPDFKTLV